MFESVRLQKFRSYKDRSFKLGPEVNVVFGPNASGKTSLLEAILIIARGKSYRNKLHQTIQHGQSWARLDSSSGPSARTVKITEQVEFSVDHKKYKRLPRSQQLPVVLFEPNHLLLLTGEPGRRRDWLDEVISDQKPSYQKNLVSYKRTLLQRNKLLKNNPQQIRKQMFAWDIRLSELAGSIVADREELINDINERIQTPYQHLAGKKQSIRLSYASSFAVASYSSKMVAKLSHELNDDIRRGFTGSGPHREDFTTDLNNQPIIEAGSRGEVRSLLISLKLLEKDWLEETSETKPIMLLDDVFSELDSQRRKALVDYLKEHQTIITTTDADLTKKYFKNSQLINLG